MRPGSGEGSQGTEGSRGNGSSQPPVADNNSQLAAFRDELLELVAKDKQVSTLETVRAGSNQGIRKRRAYRLPERLKKETAWPWESKKQRLESWIWQEKV